MKRHLITLFLLLGLLAVAVLAAFWRAQNVQDHQNDALHSIICFVEYREKSTLPPKQKEQAVAFWAKALRDAHLAPCTTK